MLKLKNKATGQELGTITEEQLKFLQEQLEEESLEDKDYWLNRNQVEVMAENGGDPALIALLNSALGNGDEVEVVWEGSVEPRD